MSLKNRNLEHFTVASFLLKLSKLITLITFQPKTSDTQKVIIIEMISKPPDNGMLYFIVFNIIIVWSSLNLGDTEGNYN